MPRTFARAARPVARVSLVFAFVALVFATLPAVTAVVSAESGSGDTNNQSASAGASTDGVRKLNNGLGLCHAFLYVWYRHPMVDKEWGHWNHEVLPHWTPAVRERYIDGVKFVPPYEVHSPYYPEKGCYSSADPAILDEQMKEMRSSSIDTAVLSWWGRPDVEGTHDTQGVSTDSLVMKVLDAAERAGMKVAFHLEPYPGRNIASIRRDVEYIHRQYASHPAVLKALPKRSHETLPFKSRPVPVFYVYDSYHIPAHEWMQLLGPSAFRSIRGTPFDGVFIGLWLELTHGRQLYAGGFDGFYTYFAATGFSFASTPSNWELLRTFADNHDLLFIPSVGPGYDDRRIRPWNGATHRPREGGAYYDRMFQAAIDVGADLVSITSYNEWGEGTQIEPAIPHKVPEGMGLSPEIREKLSLKVESENYLPHSPTHYLERTLHWSNLMREKREAAAAKAPPAPNANDVGEGATTATGADVEQGEQGGYEGKEQPSEPATFRAGEL